MSETIIMNQKIKIMLNPEQEDLINQCFGMSRFYFNKCLDWVKENYPNMLSEKKFDVTKTEISKQITKLATTLFRAKYKDLVLTTPAIIMNPSIARFKKSLTDIFFRKGKKIDYKRKHKSKQSVTFERKDHNTFRYNKDNLILTITRLRDIQLKSKIRFNEFTIRQVTISKIGKSYYATICMEVPKSEVQKLNKTHRAIALDWGVKTYLTGWNGNEVIIFDLNQEILDKYNNRIKSKQRKLEFKKFRSKNWFKVKEELEKAYFNKANYIREFIKYTSYCLARDYDKVIIEDLELSKLKTKSTKSLNRNSSDRPYYIFKKFIKYKLNQHDKKLYAVDNKFPSTQTCSNCGSVKQGDQKLTLNDRTYKCKHCGYEEDRDINASKNIFINDKIKEI